MSRGFLRPNNENIKVIKLSRKLPTLSIQDTHDDDALQTQQDPGRETAEDAALILYSKSIQSIQKDGCVSHQFQKVMFIK